ncbi:MAG: acyltransferase, partial [Ketobacter sp.]
MNQSPLTHEHYSNTQFFSCLDGLRAFSILAVIWVHTGVNETGWHILTRGQIGVDLFFAISGFLITTLLIREKNKYGFISMKGFYLRRALRIFPIYYTVIAIYTLMVLLLENNTDKGNQFFSNLPYFLTYTSNLFVENSGAVIFYFAWSLAAEEQFYMIWPSVERFLSGFRPVYIVLLILGLQGVTYLFIAQDPELSELLWIKILICIPPPILGGVALAHLLHNKASFELLRPILGLKWASLIYFTLFLAALEFAMPRLGVWIIMLFMVGSI